MSSVCSLRLQLARLLTGVLGLCAVELAVHGQDQAPVPFRLSGASDTNASDRKKPVEVTSNDSTETGSPVTIEREGTEEDAGGSSSSVVTGKVQPPAETASEDQPNEEVNDSAPKVPMPSVITPPAESGDDDGGGVEMSARAAFRMSARKPEASAAPEKSVEDRAAERRALMGPPDPSEFPGGLPPRRKSELSKTGGGSLGRAISAHHTPEGVGSSEVDETTEPTPDNLGMVEQSDGAQLLSETYTPLHPGPEVHPGQQGEIFTGADAAEPMDGESAHVETFANDGYFPTRNDNFYLGDIDYPRGRVRSGGAFAPGAVTGLGPGPASYQSMDFRSIGFTGIYPYENPDETFYDRHNYVFGPLDRALGVIGPHDAIVVENDRLQNFSGSLDGGFPVFTNRYNPDKAHFKAGPFYLDILSIGAGVLYSDYTPAKGFSPFPEGEEDGWLGYIDLDVRALLQVTNNFYLSAATRLMYLPGSNRVAWQLGYGSQPFMQFRLNYEDSFGPWDLLVYNEFRGQLGVDIWNEVGSGAEERAGRYYFGIPVVQNNRYSFFDDGAVVFLNQAGARATRALGNDWRWWLRGDRTDFWQGWDFKNHTGRNHWGTTVGYEGARLPFAPYASYDGYHFEELGSVYHHARLGGRGRLTENLSINAEGGYLWTNSQDPDQDQFTWRVGLNHDLSERTRHGISGGQYFFVNDLYPEAAVSDFISYNINHRVTENLQARLYAQWADEEYLGRDGVRRKRDMYGGYLNFRPGMFTNVQGGAYYQETRETDGDFTDDRWVYYGMVTQRVFSRLSIWFRYQFDESDFYDEHLYATGVRRYF